MTPQMLMGVLLALGLGAIYLAIVRKMTMKSFLFGLGLCGVVLLVAAQWDTVMQLSHMALAHSSASSQTAPTVHTTIKTGGPSPVAHHVSTTQALPPVVHPLSLQQMVQPSCIGSVIGVLITVFIAIKMRRRARPGYQPARQTGTLCPECRKQGDIQVYQYKKGTEQFVGVLCKECAGRYKATSPRETVKW